MNIFKQFGLVVLLSSAVVMTGCSLESVLSFGDGSSSAPINNVNNNNNNNSGNNNGGKDFTSGPIIANCDSATNPLLPPPHQPGPVTIYAEQITPQSGSITIPSSTGADVVYTHDPFHGGPLQYTLAAAIRLAQPGDVIALKGIFKAIVIGKTDPNKPYAAYWQNGAIIKDLSIISEDANQPATIDGIGITGNIAAAGQGGVDGLYFHDLIVRNGGDDRAPIMVWQNSKQGLIGLYHIVAQSVNPALYGGWGMMWNVRGHGRARYDVRGFECAGAQEHCLYLDSPGWDGSGDNYFVDVFQDAAPSGRTFIQIVNRADPNMQGGPTGLGNIFIKHARGWTTAGGGGSGITVAGHLGCVDIDDYEYKGDLGAVVFWSDTSKGLHLTPDGFTCPQAILKNIRVNSPNADRNHVAISGVGVVEIHDFQINGGKTAFSFDDTFGGPIDNGEERFCLPPLVSQYAGFQSNGKVKRNNQPLSDQQIDALQYNCP